MISPCGQAFLSCLFGSEVITRFVMAVTFFLSCLFGSEVLVIALILGYIVSELPIRQ